MVSSWMNNLLLQDWLAQFNWETNSDDCEGVSSLMFTSHLDLTLSTKSTVSCWSPPRVCAALWLGWCRLLVSFGSSYSIYFPSAARLVARNVNSSVSFGILVMNGSMSQPRPVGISRLSVTASFCT